jgi:alpha-L-arabinofuranosidase
MLDIGEGKKMTNAKVTILSGDSTDAYNDPMHPNRVVPETRDLPLGTGALEFPPHSISIVKASI